MFEDLLRQAKLVKETAEKSVKDDDDYTHYKFDDSLPDYYWGGEDGNEICFGMMTKNLSSLIIYVSIN